MFFFPICLLNKPPGLGVLRVECGSSLLMPQSLWSRGAAEGSALGNEPCCRVLPCGWFSSLYTWRVFLGGAHPPSSSDGIKQNSLAQLSLEGFVCSPLSRACWDFVPSFAPELCFFEKCLVNMGFSSCSRHKAPRGVASAVTATAAGIKCWLKRGTATSCAPLKPCRGCLEGLGAGMGRLGAVRAPLPPRSQHVHCWVRALLGLLGKLELTPGAEPGSGAATSPAREEQTAASCTQSKHNSSQGFSGGWGVLWMIPFISSGVGGELP